VDREDLDSMRNYFKIGVTRKHEKSLKRSPATLDKVIKNVQRY
jgi:hypothetical protein